MDYNSELNQLAVTVQQLFKVAGQTWSQDRYGYVGQSARSTLRNAAIKIIEVAANMGAVSPEMTSAYESAFSMIFRVTRAWSYIDQAFFHEDLNATIDFEGEQWGVRFFGPDEPKEGSFIPFLYLGYNSTYGYFDRQKLGYDIRSDLV